MDASRSEQWQRGSLCIWHSDIGILNNIQKFSGIVKIWSSELQQGSWDVIGIWGPFSCWCGDLGLSAGSLQGTQTSFHLVIWTMSMHEASAWKFGHIWIRASWGPFRLKHKTEGPSHIHIPKGKLLLRCLWKNGLPLHSQTGNQLWSPADMGCPDLSSCCFTEIDVPIDLKWVSQRISGVL